MRNCQNETNPIRRHALLRKQTVARCPTYWSRSAPASAGAPRSASSRTSTPGPAVADFDERGLWSFAGVRFSRAGTLVATAEAFVQHAEAGHFVDELDNLLHVGTQDALRKLAGDGRLTRHKLAGQFLTVRTPRNRPTNCAPDG